MAAGEDDQARGAEASDPAPEAAGGADWATPRPTAPALAAALVWSTAVLGGHSLRFAARVAQSQAACLSRLAAAAAAGQLRVGAPGTCAAAQLDDLRAHLREVSDIASQEARELGQQFTLISDRLHGDSGGTAGSYRRSWRAKP